MNTDRITPETLSSSVIAVPPLARNADLSFNESENAKLIRYIEAGGVSTLLYGGNAVFYHVAMSEYAELLTMLASLVGEQTLAIPSVGPTFGTMMDQAAILRDFEFPTAMILPQREISTSSGIASGVRRFVEAAERQAVLYIKHDAYVKVADVRALMADGLLSWIKYAVVRDDPTRDDYLRELVDAVGPTRIVSGIGEQPAIAHMREFRLAGFTSGCVCAAPRLSMNMLQAILADDIQAAKRIRSIFRPLEDLRNRINPIRVLHAAVGLADIAQMGPMIPLLDEVAAQDRPAIEKAARQLMAAEQATATS